VRNGHDVLEFSYRDLLFALSPLKSRKWAIKLAKKKTDNLLIELAGHYQPDIILIGAIKFIDAEIFYKLKECCAHAPVMSWYGDMFEGVDPKIEPIAKLCDWFMATSGGTTLRNYKNAGVPNCAFMPNPCDPDLHYQREVESRWHSELLFTGKLQHSQGGQDPLRWELIDYLVKHKNLTVWGSFSHPDVRGLDYINAICGTKIAISINAFNDVRFYHSDRFINYLSNGAFVLAKRVPDSNLLFEDKRHLCYFDSLEECLELIDFYIDRTAQRKTIGLEGMRRAHEMFNGTKLAKHIIDLVTTGKYDAPWCEVI